MRVAASIEIRPVEEKVLWLHVGTITRASDVDDEDMLGGGRWEFLPWRKICCEEASCTDHLPTMQL